MSFIRLIDVSSSGAPTEKLLSESELLRFLAARSPGAEPNIYDTSHLNLHYLSICEDGTVEWVSGIRRVSKKAPPYMITVQDYKGKTNSMEMKFKSNSLIPICHEQFDYPNISYIPAYEMNDFSLMNATVNTLPSLDIRGESTKEGHVLDFEFGFLIGVCCCFLRLTYRDESDGSPRKSPPKSPDKAQKSEFQIAPIERFVETVEGILQKKEISYKIESGRKTLQITDKRFNDFVDRHFMKWVSQPVYLLDETHIPFMKGTILGISLSKISRGFRFPYKGHVSRDPSTMIVKLLMQFGIHTGYRSYGDTFVYDELIIEGVRSQKLFGELIRSTKDSVQSDKSLETAIDDMLNHTLAVDKIGDEREVYILNDSALIEPISIQLSKPDESYQNTHLTVSVDGSTYYEPAFCY